MQAEDLARRLKERFGDKVLAIEPYPGTAGRVTFDPSIASDLFREARDGLGFHHLAMIGGIDWEDEREVLYVLWSDDVRQYLLLSARVPADGAHIESASSVWPSANWHERETWEMVGITFDHHPDLRHLLMPDGYEFHPLLRAFKLHEPEELEVKARNV